MKFPLLLCSDLHFTAHPQDEYRWALVPWLVHQAHQLAPQRASLAILGDLTDAKDHHSAALVNRVVQALRTLAEVFVEVTVLQGNHDYLEHGRPFFQFLDVIPNVRFVSEPTPTACTTATALWLPHTKDPRRDWQDLQFASFDFVFMHQTLRGAVASNGQEMDGEPMPDLSAAGKVYSGDIHVPQVVGPVEYVGSPYHVHFGDKFPPRCLLLLSELERQVLRHPNISRFALDVSTLQDVQRVRVHKGDQVKARVRLDRAELAQWPVLRKAVEAHCTAHGAQLCGIKLIASDRTHIVGAAESRRSAALSPEAALELFVRREDWGADALDVGLELLQ